MENHLCWLENSLNMASFNSYVKLPEGKCRHSDSTMEHICKNIPILYHDFPTKQHDVGKNTPPWSTWEIYRYMVNDFRMSPPNWYSSLALSRSGFLSGWSARESWAPAPGTSEARPMGDQIGRSQETEEQHPAIQREKQRLNMLADSASDHKIMVS